MRYWFVALAFLASSCGSVLQSIGIEPNPEVDPTFAIYYSRWVMDANRFNAELSLGGLVVMMGRTQDFPGGEAATCGPSRTILINPIAWGNMTRDWEAEKLLYHELGHCTLGQNHRQGLSVMNPALSSSYYRDHREELLQELFTFGTWSAPAATYR